MYLLYLSSDYYYYLVFFYLAPNYKPVYIEDRWSFLHLHLLFFFSFFSFDFFLDSFFFSFCTLSLFWTDRCWLSLFTGAFPIQLLNVCFWIFLLTGDPAIISHLWTSLLTKIANAKNIQLIAPIFLKYSGILWESIKSLKLGSCLLSRSSDFCAI